MFPLSQTPHKKTEYSGFFIILYYNTFYMKKGVRIMNGKILGLIIIIMILIIGVFFYLSRLEQKTVEEPIIAKKEKVTPIQSLATEAVVLEDKSIALVEKVQEEVVEEVKVEAAIPNGFVEVSSEELQEIAQGSFNKESYTELYDQDNLNIYIDNELQKSMKKSKVQNLSLLVIKYIQTGTVVIKNDENKKLYLEILEYKNSEQMDLGDKFAKSEHIYHFGFNKSEINEDENIELFLQDLDIAIKEADAKNLILVGYTDSVGSQQYNTFLSYKRAQALSDKLKQQNIAVKYVLRGEANPIASNKTPEGRAQNRRIEMFLGL